MTQPPNNGELRAAIASSLGQFMLAQIELVGQLSARDQRIAQLEAELKTLKPSQKTPRKPKTNGVAHRDGASA